METKNKMQGIKPCDHGWKLFEFDDVYPHQHVIGLFDTYFNAIQSIKNIIIPSYSITRIRIQGYKCLVLNYEHRYIAAIYIEKKLIYLDPHPSEVFSLVRKWKTKKDIIQQLTQFIKLLEPIEKCCIN